MLAIACIIELTPTILLLIDIVLTLKMLHKSRLRVFIAEYVVEIGHYDVDKNFSNVPKINIAHIHITHRIDATFFGSYVINIPPYSQHRISRLGEFKVLHARTSK